MTVPSAGARRRVYLDTQQWNHFVDSASPNEIGIPLDLIEEAAAAGLIEIIGSLPLLEELIGASNSKPAKFRAMRALFFRLVGNRILQPLNIRHIGEATTGGLMPVAGRFLPRDTRRGVERMARQGADLKAVSAEVWGVGDRSRRRERENLVSATGRIAALGLDPSIAVADWYSGAPTDEWVQDFVEAGVREGRIAPDLSRGTGYEQFPSLWLLTSYRLARMKLAIADGRGIRRSDQYDAEHCASGGYVDHFVTDDKAFGETLTAIERLPFAWFTSADFTLTLENAL